MKHDLSSYTDIVELLDTVDEHFSENIIMRFEDYHDDLMEKEDNPKKKGKLVKTYHKDMKLIDPVNDSVYKHMLHLRHLRKNVDFVLTNAHNNTSYYAIARYMAEYDFFVKKIKKELNKCNHTVVETLLQSIKDPLIDRNYFDTMLSAVEEMKENIRNRYEKEPESYVHPDPESTLDYTMLELKQSFKDKMRQLKKDDMS